MTLELIITIYLLICMVLGIVGYAINQRPLSFILGFLFGVLGLIIVGIMYVADNNSNKKEPERRTRRRQTNSSHDSNTGIIIFFGVSVGVLLIIITCLIFDYKNTKDEREKQLMSDYLEAQERVALREQEILLQAEQEQRELDLATIKYHEKKMEDERIAREQAEELELKRQKYFEERDKREEEQKQRQIIIERDREAQRQQELALARQEAAIESAKLAVIEEQRKEERAQNIDYANDLISIILNSDNWNRCKEAYNKLLELRKESPYAVDYDTMKLFSLYEQPEKIEIITMNDRELMGSLSGSEIILYMNGKQCGSMRVDLRDIIRTRLATVDEWKQTLPDDDGKEVAFDWDTWKQKQILKREQDKRDFESARRRLDEKKRLRELEEKKSRILKPEPKRLTSIGLQ